MKKSRKGKIIAICIPLAILLALEIFLCVWFFGANYSDFDRLTKKERAIPGLSSGLSPQGLCPLPESSGYDFAMSGYVPGEASRVYLIGETEKYVTLEEDGNAVSTHFGGITCAGDSLYVASGKGVIRISLQDALDAEDGGAVEVKGKIEADLRSAAYCYYYDGALFIGEFYRPGNYETDESHHLEENGETNYAFIYVYRETEDGFEETPRAVISVREQVQGIAIWEDGIALSTSYGLPNSKIFFYKNVLAERPLDEFDSHPIRFRLDSTNLIAEWETPCMSEEIFVKDGRLYVLYESLCNKYKYFVRRRIDSILSVSLGDIL